MGFFSKLFKKVNRKIRFLPDYEKILKTLKLDNEVWKMAQLEAICTRLRPHRQMYFDLEEILSVPAWVICGIQWRENSSNYPNLKANMVNGEPIDKVTTLVPKGLGPWKDWKAACIDAFKRRDYNPDWSVAEWFEFCERYNGIGNRYYGQESTYVLSFTSSSDEKGKYIGDGKYSYTKEDTRAGIAAIYLYMKQSKGGLYREHTRGW